MTDQRDEDERRERELGAQRERVEDAMRRFAARKTRDARLSDAAASATRSDLVRKPGWFI